MPVIREGVGIMPVLSESLGTAGIHCGTGRHCGGDCHLGLAAPASHGAGGMMLAWILSPARPLAVPRRRRVRSPWDCLAQGPGCRQGRLAGKAPGSKGQSHHHILGDST